MSVVRITKYSDAGTLILKNFYLTEIINNETLTTKILLKDIPLVIQEKFGIPSGVVKKAISHFKKLKDIYE
jgi:hypothetical protein